MIFTRKKIAPLRTIKGYCQNVSSKESVPTPQKEYFKYNILDGLDEEQKKLAIQLKSILEKKLFLWGDFPIDYPKSQLSANGERIITIDEIFSFENFNELDEVARHPNGKLKRLSKEQLQSIKKNAEFSVQSQRFPDRYHVWRLKSLIQYPQERIKDNFLDMIAYSVMHFEQEIPRRFFSKDFLSFRSGFENIWKGIKTIPDGLIGIKEYTYNTPKINEELLNYITKDLQKENKDSEIYKTSEGLEIDMTIFNKYEVKILSDVQQIQNKVFKQFNKKNYSIRLELLKDILSKEGKGLEDIKESMDSTHYHFHNSERNIQLSEKLEDALTSYYNKKLLEEIKNAGYDKMHDYLLSGYIFEDILEERRIKEKEREDKITMDLKKKYPLRSRAQLWVNNQVEIELQKQKEDIEERNSVFEKAIMRLQEELINPEPIIYILKKTKEFMEQPPNIKRKPDLTPIIFRKFIWRQNNWIITKHQTVIGKGIYYLAKKDTEMKVFKTYPGWRFAAFFTRIYAWMSNFFYLVMVKNLFRGPLSIRALIAPYSFYPYKKVLETSGDIVTDDRRKVNTFLSRLITLWENVFKARRIFELQPDTGFLGKSFSRIFNVIWNYIFKGLLGTMIITTLFPSLVLINIIASIILLIASPLVVPLAAASLWIINSTIYDFDTIHTHKNWFKLVSALLNISLGFAQIFSSALMVTIIDPLICLSIVMASGIISTIQTIHNKIMYYLLILPLGRVPANNDTFFIYRIAGPGLSSSLFYQIDTSVAIYVLQLYLESEELKFFKEKILEKLNQPYQAMKNLENTLFKPFTLQFSSSVQTRIYERNEKIIEGLNKNLKEKNFWIDIPNRYMIRQTLFNQCETIQKGMVLVKTFYTDRIFTRMDNDEINAFWQSQTLEKNDWIGLTKKLFSQVFCPEFLTTMEETDQCLKLQVDHLNLGEYCSSLFEGEPSEDLNYVYFYRLSLLKLMKKSKQPLSVDNIVYNWDNHLKNICKKKE